MNGLRLSAGAPDNALLSVTYTPSNIDSNLLITIPSSNSTEAFRFITGQTSNQVMTLTGTGRLGIGVSDPQSALHIGGQSISLSNSSNPYIVLQANSTGTALMGVATTATVFSADSMPGSYVIRNFTGGKVILQTGGAGSAICINTNNNVGIKNPSAVYPLDVIGDINLTGTLRKNGSPYIGSQWSNVASNVFVMGSNVAIGLSNGVEALHVSGKVYSDNQFLGSNASSNAPSYSFLEDSNTGLYSPSNNAVALVTGGIERLRVLNNGNIGIGTSNATATLTVAGDIALSNIVTISINGSNLNTRHSSLASTNYALQQDAAGKTGFAGGALYATPAGNVGIGTSNAAVPLEVYSTVPGNGLRVTCSNGDTNIAINCGNNTNSAVLLFNSSNGAKSGNISMLNSGEMTYNASNMHSWKVNGANKLYLNPSAGAFYPAIDNDLSMGGGINRWLAVYATNGTIQTSDSQEKNYSALTYGLSNLLMVDTIKYKWKTQDLLPDTDPQKNYEYYGVLADQVDQLFPELVYNQQRPYQLNYTELIPVCINAIKDLNGLLLASRSNTESALQSQQVLQSQLSAVQSQAIIVAQSNTSLAQSLQQSIAQQQSLESQLSVVQSQASLVSQSNAALYLQLQQTQQAQHLQTQAQLSNLGGQIALSDLNKTYIDVLPLQGISTYEMTVIGIDRNGLLTEKFSESVHFVVASTGGRLAIKGYITLATQLSGSPGDHIVPVLGPKDSIALSAVQDYRVSFAEFRMSLGRIVIGSTINLR
jgi:hypothetical protein